MASRWSSLHMPTSDSASFHEHAHHLVQAHHGLAPGLRRFREVRERGSLPLRIPRADGRGRDARRGAMLAMAGARAWHDGTGVDVPKTRVLALFWGSSESSARSLALKASMRKGVVFYSRRKSTLLRTPPSPPPPPPVSGRASPRSSPHPRATATRDTPRSTPPSRGLARAEAHQTSTPAGRRRRRRRESLPKNLHSRKIRAHPPGQARPRRRRFRRFLRFRRFRHARARATRSRRRPSRRPVTPVSPRTVGGGAERAPREVERERLGAAKRSERGVERRRRRARRKRRRQRRRRLRRRAWRTTRALETRRGIFGIFGGTI